MGYEDMVPVTAAGRAISFVLMHAGIAFFGGLTANLAALLTRGTDHEDRALTNVMRELKELRAELASLRADLR